MAGGQRKQGPQLRLYPVAKEDIVTVEKVIYWGDLKPRAQLLAESKFGSGLSRGQKVVRLSWESQD